MSTQHESATGQWAGDSYQLAIASHKIPEPATVKLERLQDGYRAIVRGAWRTSTIEPLVTVLDWANAANESLVLVLDSVVGDLEGLGRLVHLMRNPASKVDAVVINAMGPACVVAANASASIAVPLAKLGGLKVSDFDGEGVAGCFEQFAVEDVRVARPHCLATAADLRGELSAAFAYEVDLIDRIYEVQS